MKITIQHYGAFRKFGHETFLDISTPATVGTIRSALITKLGEEHKLLVEDSALVNDTDILPDEYVIGTECTLSVLPPVCGG